MGGVKGQGSPSQLKSPVPDVAPTGSALEGYEPPQDSALADYTPPASADPRWNQSDLNAQPTEASLSGPVLDTAARAADYGGGIVRTGVAGAAGVVTGNQTVTAKDLKNMLKGQAPGSAEYLQRMGMEEGPAIDIPGLGHLSARDIAGLAGDITTDPLTVVARSVKTMPYLGKLLNSGGLATEALGEAVYKSAVRSTENKLVRAGKIEKGTQPIGDALVEAGAPVGGMEKLARNVDEISSTMGKMRQALYARATELGVTVDTGYPLKHAEGVIADMKRHPPLVPLAEKLEADLINPYKGAGRVTLEQLSDWKTELYQSLPASAYGPNGRMLPAAKKLKAALARDFKDAIVQAGNKAEKGLGDSINQINEKWGPLLAARPQLAKDVAGTAGGLGQQIDAAVLATGGLKAALIKKSYDMATSPQARTLIGRALMEGGKSGMMDAAQRQALVNIMRLKRGQLPPTEEPPQ